MSESTVETRSAESTQTHASDALPHALRARLNGQLDGRPIVAWSQYDLDEHNRYATRYAVLTDHSLLIFTGDDGAAPREIPITEIGGAKMVEGLGVDCLNVIIDGARVAEMRYPLRHRRGMTRLQRKLERRLPAKAG